MLFEESMRVEAGRRGLEHLGTWNASIQSNKFDGVYVCLSSTFLLVFFGAIWRDRDANLGVGVGTSI